MKPIVISFLVLIGSSSQLIAQDTIHKKDGTVLNGVVKIEYNPQFFDLALFEDQQTNKRLRIPVSEIDSITFFSGEKYFLKEVSFLSRSESEITNQLLLRELLLGEVSLYEYKGDVVDFFVEIDREIYVFQEIENYDNVKTITGFQSTKLLVFSGCLEREYLFKVDLRRNEIVEMVNNYNNCVNPHYEPYFKAKERKDIKYFSLGFGSNSSQLDINAPIFTIERGQLGLFYREFSRLKTVGSTSNSFEIGLKYFDNISSLENLFVYIGFNVSDYKFNLVTTNQVKVTSLGVLESSIAVGPSYSIGLFKKLEIQLGAGPLMWFNLKTTNNSTVRTTISNTMVLPTSSFKKSGFGGEVFAATVFNLNDTVSFFFEFKYLFRDGENRFTQNFSEFVKDSLVPRFIMLESNDEVVYNHTLTGGIRVSFKRTGVF